MNRIFQIYHNLNCRSKYVKAETEFNIRLNIHQKDLWNSDFFFQAVIFQTKTITQHTCEIHAEEKSKVRLKQKKNFWILTLETVRPKGLKSRT